MKNKRVKCEVWARCCGYLRPINKWNDGKAAEFNDREVFTTK
jgi:anaerobic ribonucleoside-triphosphate reductase